MRARYCTGPIHVNRRVSCVKSRMDVYVWPSFQTVSLGPFVFLHVRVPPSVRTGRSSTFTLSRFNRSAFIGSRGVESCDPNLSRYRCELVECPWDALWSDNSE